MGIIITHNEGLPPWKVIGIYSPVLKYRYGGGHYRHETRVNFYNALKYSSAYYVTKPEVRNFVFERNNHTCVLCGTKENLSVDHIVSIYACSVGEIPLDKLNHIDNLQTLCRSCNSAKTP
jgi:hypothetical protein